MGFFSDIKGLFTMKYSGTYEEMQEAMRKEFKDELNLNYYDNLMIKDLKGIKIVGNNGLYILEDRLIFNMLLTGTDLKDGRTILKSDIKSIKYMTGEEIREKSKLGQMMIIGIFALGTKPNTEVIDFDRVVIDICEEGIDFQIAFSNNKVNAKFPYDNLETAKRLNKWFKTGTWE